MNLVSDLDLPAFDYAEPGEGGADFDITAAHADQVLTFTAAMSPNHGRAPDVS
jgi:hypothetical protein